MPFPVIRVNWCVVTSSYKIFLLRDHRLCQHCIRLDFREWSQQSLCELLGWCWPRHCDPDMRQNDSHFMTINGDYGS